MRLRLFLLALVCGCSESKSGSASSTVDDDTSNDDATTRVCKRGLAYGESSENDLRALSPRVGWWYNWAASPNAEVASVYAEAGTEYVPMIWGSAFDVDDATASIPSDAKYLLGFNEPNFGSQASIPADEAAALWPKLEAIADARGLELVAPAVNFCGGDCNATSPFDYLQSFFDACDGCRVDFIAAHWYACDRSALSWYLGELESFGKPIWLTEFACLDGDDTSTTQQATYMADALDLLENDPQVFRYAWFTGRYDSVPSINLLGEDGELTELGRQYVDASSSCD